MAFPPQGELILGVKSVKLMFYFKNLLSYSNEWFRQGKYMPEVMMTTEGYMSYRKTFIISLKYSSLLQSIHVEQTILKVYS